MNEKSKPRAHATSRHDDAGSKAELSVNLKGFYITPFKQKKVSVEGTGATRLVEKTVDFGQVIKTVKDCLASQSYRLGNTLYTFTIEVHQILDKYLDDSIMKNIDDADYVVVDWTTGNPNVLNEAGYARGRGKHGIHISGDGSLPSDKAGIIYALYEPENPQSLAKSLPDLISELVKRIEAGPRVFDYYDSRSTMLIDKMMDEAETEICILQTNLETVNANHVVALIAALRRNVKVRILTLDPQSRYVNERALQLGYTNATIKVYRNGLQTSIDNLAARLASQKGWRIKLYNDFPTQLTYIMDNRILVSIVSRTGRSRDNCVFVLPSSRLKGPRHTFIEHFDQLWDSANQEIPLFESNAENN